MSTVHPRKIRPLSFVLRALVLASAASTVLSASGTWATARTVYSSAEPALPDIPAAPLRSTLEESWLGGLVITPHIVNVGQVVTMTVGDPALWDSGCLMDYTNNGRCITGFGWPTPPGKVVSGCGSHDTSCSFKAAPDFQVGWDTLTLSVGGTIGTGCSEDVLYVLQKDRAVTGYVHGPDNKPVEGASVVISGPTSVTAITNADGYYQKAVKPGTYTVHVDNAKAVACVGGGTTASRDCSLDLSFQSGEADFVTRGNLVVNSTSTDQDPEVSLKDEVCDITPTGPAETCTLPAAVQLANMGVGDDITFDIPGGGVPQIAWPSKPRTGIEDDNQQELKNRTTIDGETQTGSHKVEVTNSGGFICDRPCTLKGLVVNTTGDDSDPSAMVDMPKGGVLQDDCIYTDATCSSYVGQPDACKRGCNGVLAGPHSIIGGSAPGDGNVILVKAGVNQNGTALEMQGLNGFFPSPDNLYNGPANSVVEGNTIGAFSPQDPSLKLTDRYEDGYYVPALGLVAKGNDITIGGARPGAGNLIVTSLEAEGINDVVQGNTTYGGIDVVGNHDTIGGATSKPGGPPGNTIDQNGLLLSGSYDVVQGNALTGGGAVDTLKEGVLAAYLGVYASGSDETIGGSEARLGNLITGWSGATGATSPSGGVFVYYEPPGEEPDGNWTLFQGPALHDVIESNTITNDFGMGAVTVARGRAVDVYGNTMGQDSVGINLGGGLYEVKEHRFDLLAPNHDQPWPTVVSVVARGSRIEVTGGLSDLMPGAGQYHVDVYDAASCNTVDPVGTSYVGRHAISDRLLAHGKFTLDLPPPPANALYTWTATAPDGSTSEFGPCFGTPT